jgi:hypothetical protein
MALIKHKKTNNITNWTQPQLNTILSGGAAPLPPAGTVLNDVVLPSDWNDDHDISGLLANANTFTAAQGVTLSGIANTVVAGETLSNSTLSTNAVKTQNSPAMFFNYHGWEAGTNVDRPISFGLYGTSSSPGSGAPTGTLQMISRIGTGTYNAGVSFDTSGRMTVPGTANLQGQLLIGGPFTANGIGSFNQAVTFYNSVLGGNATFTGTMAIGYAATVGTSLSVGTNITAGSGALAYNNTDETLVVGGVPARATIHGETTVASTIAAPSLSVNIGGAISDAATPTSIYVTQGAPRLGQPLSFLASQHNDASGAFIANGSNYNIKIWAFDGTNFTVVPASYNFNDDGSTNNFRIDSGWMTPAYGSPSSYRIGVSVNGGTEQYIDVGNVTSYSDYGTSYPESAPSPLSPDYVANGTYRTWTAYGTSNAPDSTQFFSTGAQTYNFTDDGSGTPCSMVHNNAYSVRVLGDPSGSGSSNYFDTGGSSSFNEYPDSWASGSTVTPVLSSIAYYSDGSALNVNYVGYNYNATLNVYSPSSAPAYGVDPNDGQYYQPQVTASGQTATYKVQRSGGQSGSHTASTTSFFYTPLTSNDNATITPNTLYKPGLIGAKPISSLAEVGATVSQNTGSPSYIIHSFLDGSDAIVGQLYVDELDGNKLKFLGSSGTTTTLALP